MCDILFLLLPLFGGMINTSKIAKKFTNPRVQEPPGTFLGGSWRVDLYVLEVCHCGVSCAEHRII
jgi:hypothetical protein